MEKYRAAIVIEMLKWEEESRMEKYYEEEMEKITYGAKKMVLQIWKDQPGVSSTKQET